MTADKPSPQSDLSDTLAEELTVDDVVSRLDRLWASEQPSLPSPLATVIGTSIGPYKIERLIGRGAFGMVYQATDGRLKRDIALKIPRIEVLADEKMLRRFEREAQATAGLEHPFIVPVYEAELDGATPYIASAYCAGPNLQQWLDETPRKIAAREATQFIAGMANAVDYAHKQGVLHRDLKPANILLAKTPDGQASDDANSLWHFVPRVTDFGLAQVGSETKDTSSSLLIGTPLYMSPEQAECRHEEVDATTDVFALGAILYHLLTGAPPFVADSYPGILKRLQDDTPNPVTASRPGVDRDLETVCLKCLEKSPSDRYPSVAELEADLQRYLAGQSVMARPLGRWERLSRWSRQRGRVSEAMMVIVSASVTRLVFSGLGLSLLIALNEVPPTASELSEVLLFLLCFTTPLEALLISSVRHHAAAGTAGKVYWLGFLACAIGMWACLLTAIGVLPAPLWYQRMPGARTLMFCVIALLFAIQVIAWHLSDWARIKPAMSSPRRRLLKTAVWWAPAIVIVAGWASFKLRRPEIVPLPGPPTSISLDRGDDRIEVLGVGFVEDEPFTLEAWIHPESTLRGTVVQHGPISIETIAAGESVRIRVELQRRNSDVIIIDGDETISLGRWAHIAFIYDGQTTRLAINGNTTKHQVSLYSIDVNSTVAFEMPPTLTLPNLWPGEAFQIGFHPSTQREFEGKIGEVRLSRSVFYPASFIPASKLSVGNDTRMLLHLENASDRIEDATGRFTASVYRDSE